MDTRLPWRQWHSRCSAAISAVELNLIETSYATNKLAEPRPALAPAYIWRIIGIAYF